MINDAAGGDGPCETCGGDPASCACPKCPTCGRVGAPECYEKHELSYSRDQLDGLDRLRISELEAEIADLRMAIEFRARGD
jgi:hypothetical protein